jgi:hypothetical protein
MKTYGFIRREAEPEHKCRLPMLRWLPWIVVPRWKVGALWRCECDRVYEWKIAWIGTAERDIPRWREIYYPTIPELAEQYDPPKPPPV